jgi:hypothetical protein
MRLRINNSSISVIGKWVIFRSITKVTCFWSANEKPFPAIKFCKKTKNITINTNTNSKEIEKT